MLVVGLSSLPCVIALLLWLLSFFSEANITQDGDEVRKQIPITAFDILVVDQHLALNTNFAHWDGTDASQIIKNILPFLTVLADAAILTAFTMSVCE